MLPSAPLKHKLCSSVRVNYMNDRSKRILTQQERRAATALMPAWTHMHVVCCVWSSSVAEFLVSTQENVRMKSPLGTQTEGTSPLRPGHTGIVAEPAAWAGFWVFLQQQINLGLTTRAKIDWSKGNNTLVMNKHIRLGLWTERKVPLYPQPKKKITKSSRYQCFARRHSSIYSTGSVVQMAAGGVDQLHSHSQNLPPFDWFNCHPVCLWHCHCVTSQTALQPV